jgi:hypothetical protein
MVTYPGPRRRVDQVATIEVKDTLIQEIDGVPVRGTTFELLPGPHALRVRFVQARQEPFGGRHYSTGSLAVCFTAREGRSYTVVPAVNLDGTWKPEIVDRDTTYRITVRYAMPGTAECLGESRRTTPVAAEPVQPAEPPGVAELPEATRSERPRADAGAHAVAAQPGEDRSGPAVAIQPLPELPPRRPPLRRPTTLAVGAMDVTPRVGIGLEAGLFIGGDTLVGTQRANGQFDDILAGSGFQLSLATMLTPFWISRSIGFGFDLNGGFKFNSIEAPNATITFQRFPLGGGIHALIRLDDRWFLVPRLGLFGDLRARLSGTGDAAGIGGDLATGLGKQLELGMFWVMGRAWGLAAKMRYSMLEYSVGGSTLNGSSVGFTAAGYVTF